MGVMCTCCGTYLCETVAAALSDLRARLVEVEAERDAALAAEKHQHSERWIEKRMRHEAEARLVEVEAERDALTATGLSYLRRLEAVMEVQDELTTRLAAVEALRPYGAYVGYPIHDDREVLLLDEVRAAARGEGRGTPPRQEEDLVATTRPTHQRQDGVSPTLAEDIGEGDRPAESTHEFEQELAPGLDAPCLHRLPNDTICWQRRDHPIHSGEGDRG